MTIRIVLIYSISLFSAFISPFAYGKDVGLQGVILTYKDGDTVIFSPMSTQPAFELRIKHMDAPETRKSQAKPGQPGAVQATRLLEHFTAGKTLIARCAGQSYGRPNCTLHTPQGKDIGQMMVEAGMAHAWPEGKISTYSTAELAARLSKRGVWSGSPIHPSSWRDRCWKQGYCPQAE